MNFRPGRPETLKTVFGFRELSLAPTAHMNETHFFKLFWIPSRRPAKRTRCHAGKGAEPRAVPNLVVKKSKAKGVRIIGSPSILRWSGRASHLEATKNHQTQGQCRISWDRKQSLLVDPIRAPTRDNATRLAGLVPENSGHSIPMPPGAACRTIDDCQRAQAPCFDKYIVKTVPQMIRYSRL